MDRGLELLKVNTDRTANGSVEHDDAGTLAVFSDARTTAISTMSDGPTRPGFATRDMPVVLGLRPEHVRLNRLGPVLEQLSR